MKTTSASSNRNRQTKIRKWLKWPLRVMAVGFIGIIALILAVFNPSWSYAHASEVHGWEILHNSSLEAGWDQRIAEAEALLGKSEIYDPNWRLQICLQDGSRFPALIKMLQGDAFAYGYYNKIVFNASADPMRNVADLRGFHWNLSQLIAHEAVHCMQYNHLGFFLSNPLAGIANWKWEGYPEFIARGNAGLGDLHQQIERWHVFKSTPNDGWILLPDGTGTTAVLYQARMLVTFSMEIEGKSWEQVLMDPRKESEVEGAMLHWHSMDSSDCPS